jgi:hypothetical protein
MSSWIPSLLSLELTLGWLLSTEFANSEYTSDSTLLSGLILSIGILFLLESLIGGVLLGALFYTNLGCFTTASYACCFYFSW